MKKLLLVLLLGAFVTPIFVHMLPGLGLTSAYAQDEGDDNQGDDDTQ